MFLVVLEFVVVDVEFVVGVVLVLEFVVVVLFEREDTVRRDWG